MHTLLQGSELNLQGLDELEHESLHPRPHLRLEYHQIFRRKNIQLLDQRLCIALMQHALVLDWRPIHTLQSMDLNSSMVMGYALN